MTPVFDSAESCIVPLFSCSSDEPVFLGTSFSLWSSRFWITAAHCLDGVDLETLLIKFSATHTARVKFVAKHGKGDVAVLELIETAPSQQNYFRSVVPAHTHGFQFHTFGYPEDTMGPNAGLTVPRFFNGYFQRVFEHKSHMGYEYMAAELSIACPSGLSGGPIYSTESSAIVGLVCDNLESSLWLNTIEREDSVRDNNFKMLNYGVGILLDPLKDWLEQHIQRQR